MSEEWKKKFGQNILNFYYWGSNTFNKKVQAQQLCQWKQHGWVTGRFSFDDNWYEQTWDKNSMSDAVIISCLPFAIAAQPSNLD